MIKFESFDNDKERIANKYHLTSEPFTGFNQMLTHGYDYDRTTGKSDDEIREELFKLNEKKMPYVLQKAESVKFVLENSMINVDESDYFVGLYSWGRIIDKSTLDVKKNEVVTKFIPDEQKFAETAIKAGLADVWPDYDHAIPNWDDILSLGFAGLYERIKKYHQIHIDSGDLTEEQDLFYRAMETEYESILHLIRRWIDFAESHPCDKTDTVVECLKSIETKAPENTYEALQTMYIFHLISESVDHIQVRSLGNGLDKTLYPFYKKDIESGKFTKEKIGEFLAYYMYQYHAMGNYFGQPFYLGGSDKFGNTAVNELSYLIIDVYEQIGIYNPKIQIKWSENTPSDFRNKLLRLVRNGRNSIVFVCEPAIIKATMSYGATKEEALTSDISGCYEVHIKGKEVVTAGNYVNMLKILLITLNDGFDTFSNSQLGLHTGKAEDFKSFDEFYFAYVTQLKFVINKVIWAANGFDEYLDYINPSIMFTATVDNALKRGIEAYARGMKFNNSAILCCGFASAVDSLMAVKKAVYDEKTVTMETLNEALKNDWEGYEKLREYVKHLPNKYGNDDTETDEYAVALARIYSQTVDMRPNGRGGIYKAIMHTALHFINMGKTTQASPDGRKLGDEISKNGTPSVGMDKNGVTALINSVIKLEPWNFTEDFCVDIMLHPSSVEGDDGIDILNTLIDTYAENGGYSIQFNIMDVQLLRDAQKNPEKYKNLQVRVCGWNVLWNNLSPEEQEAYIERAKNIK